MKVCFHAGMDISTINYDSALAYFKKPRRLAFALGITQQAVYLWHRKLPDLRKPQIALLIAGDWNNSAQAQAYDARYKKPEAA